MGSFNSPLLCMGTINPDDQILGKYRSSTILSKRRGKISLSACFEFMIISLLIASVPQDSPFFRHLIPNSISVLENLD